MIAIDGHLLPSDKQQEEAARIEKLVSHAPDRRKLEEVQKKDTEQCEVFFKMIPDAFLFSYEGREGDGGIFSGSGIHGQSLQRWLVSLGDLAVMHPNSYIELRDRSKDIIISVGEKYLFRGSRESPL